MESHFPRDCAARFLPERLLAEGTFGRVYLCNQLDLGRPVVVKVLNAACLGSTVQVQRFLHEARVTAALRHPHIVGIIDHGQASDLPWIAYEWVGGGTLATRIEQGPLDPPVVARLGIQVSEALVYAHQLGVLHRDIKPSNVLLVDPRMCKVSDFGLASWTQRHEGLTATGALVGTPMYMAPEMINGEGASAPSDIYALGATLFEMLTGRTVFETPNMGELLHLQVTTPPVDVRQLNPVVPEDLAGIVAACLDKVPSRRQSPSALVHQLQLCLQRGPSKPRSIGRSTAPSTPTARRQARGNEAKLALAFLAGSMVAGLVMYGRPAREASPSPLLSSSVEPRGASPSGPTRRNTDLPELLREFELVQLDRKEASIKVSRSVLDNPGTLPIAMSQKAQSGARQHLAGLGAFEGRLRALLTKLDQSHPPGKVPATSVAGLRARLWGALMHNGLKQDLAQTYCESAKVASDGQPWNISDQMSVLGLNLCFSSRVLQQLEPWRHRLEGALRAIAMDPETPPARIGALFCELDAITRELMGHQWMEMLPVDRRSRMERLLHRTVSDLSGSRSQQVRRLTTLVWNAAVVGRHIEVKDTQAPGRADLEWAHATFPDSRTELGELARMLGMKM